MEGEPAMSTLPVSFRRKLRHGACLALPILSIGLASVLAAAAEQAGILRRGSYQEITNSIASGYAIQEFRVSGDGSRVVFRVTEQVTDGTTNCANMRQQIRVIDASGANERVIFQGFTWRNNFNVCQTSLNDQYDISHDGSLVAIMHQETPSNPRWLLSIQEVDTGAMATVLITLPYRAFGESSLQNLAPYGGNSYFKLSGDGSRLFFVNNFGPYGPPGNTGEPEASGMTIYAVSTDGGGAVPLLSNSQLQLIPGVTSSAVNVVGDGGYFGTDETGSWLAAFAGGNFPSANPARYLFRLDPAIPGPGGATVLLDLGNHRISGVSVSRDGARFVYALYATGDEMTDGIFVQDSAMLFSPIRLSRPGSQINRANPRMSADGTSVSYNIDIGGGSSSTIRWAATDGALRMPMSEPSTRAVNRLSGISGDGHTVFYMGAVMPNVSNAPLPAVNLIRASWVPAVRKSPAVITLTATPELTLLRQSIFDNTQLLRTYYYHATGSGLQSMYSFPYNQLAERETLVRGNHYLGGIKDDGVFDGDAAANDGIYTDAGLTADIALEDDIVTLRAAVSTNLGTSAFTDFAIPTRDIVPPMADFSAFPTEGPAPLTVSFTDLSTGDIYRSEWRLQNGAVLVVNPEPPLTHTYQNPGLYTVRLTVSRQGMSDTEEKMGYITVTEPVVIPIPGDINDDGVVNAVDVQLVVNAALGLPVPDGVEPDLNKDGVVNAVDVQLVINAALGLEIIV